MSKRKRTHAEKHRLIQETLEAHRRFDFEYVPYSKWDMPDENYKYEHGFFGKVAEGTVRVILQTIGMLIIKVAYGAKVTGKKYKKELKDTGAFCVMNHFSFLDTIFVRAAAGHFRSYHTMAPENNRRGLLGWIIRHAALLPFSENIHASKHLNERMEQLLKKKKIINVYAEKAMWIDYQKPRPMKEGAFHYAVKYSVPVLPIFCTFEKTKRGRMKKLRINILPPVYENAELPRHERMEDMGRRTEDEWKECYEERFGPLKYLEKSDIKKERDASPTK